MAAGQPPVLNQLERLNVLKQSCFGNDRYYYSMANDFAKHQKELFQSFDPDIAALKKQALDKIEANSYLKDWEIATKFQNTSQLRRTLQTTDVSYTLHVGRVEQLSSDMWSRIRREQKLDAHWSVLNLYYVELHAESEHSLKDFIDLPHHVTPDDVRNDTRRRGFLYVMVMKEDAVMNFLKSFSDLDLNAEFTKSKMKSSRKELEKIAEDLKVLEETAVRKNTFSDLKAVLDNADSRSVFYIGRTGQADWRGYIQKRVPHFLQDECSYSSLKQFIFKKVKAFYYPNDSNVHFEKSLVEYAIRQNVKLFNERMGVENGGFLYILWYREKHVPQYFFNLVKENLIDVRDYIT